MASLSNSLYDMPGLAPRMNVLFHAKKSLPVYLYINQLFQIITSLALDNLSEFELVTIVIIGYM